MARQKKRKSRPGGLSDPAMGCLLGALGLALLAGLGAAYYFALTQPDPAADCEKGHPRAVHALVVDHSDAITGQQSQFIRQAVARLKDTAEEGTRFEIFTFTGNTSDELPSLLSVCVPRRPEKADPTFENKKLLRKEFEEHFSQVMDKNLDELLNQQPQQTSPIVESIRAAAQTAFGPFSEGEVPMRLTIVSDMIQHSSVSSHLREEPKFERLSHLAVWPSLRPRLKGANVNVMYILRPTALRAKEPVQTRGHQVFWEQLLTASGGVVTLIEPF